MKKKLLAIVVTTIFIAMVFSSATVNATETNEGRESLPEYSYEIYPLASIELNKNSEARLLTYYLRTLTIPLYKLNGLNPPKNCIIVGLLVVKIITGTLTLKPLNKESVTLYPGTALALHGFVGKAEGKTDWRDWDVVSISGKAGVIVVQLP